MAAGARNGVRVGVRVREGGPYFHTPTCKAWLSACGSMGATGTCSRTSRCIVRVRVLGGGRVRGEGASCARHWDVSARRKHTPTQAASKGRVAGGGTTGIGPIGLALGLG